MAPLDFCDEAPRGSSAVGPDRRISLKKVVAKDIDGLLGKAVRNPITGIVKLKGVEEWRDFSLVDLWTRSELVGMPEEIVRDRHLFRAVPLSYRTWLYHSMHQKVVNQGCLGLTKELGVLAALGTRCIDAPFRSGRWSPMMFYTPTLPLVLLTSDTLILVFGLLLVGLTLLTSVVTNTYDWYRIDRLLTFPFRVIYLVFVFSRVFVSAAVERGEFMSILGFIIVISISIVELFLGDVQIMRSLRYHCTYDIIRSLPNQVFVCRRKGDIARVREGRVPHREEITGVADTGGASFALLANVQGVIVELIPLSERRDMSKLVETLLRTHHTQPRFVGANIFSQVRASVKEVDQETCRMERLRQYNTRLASITDKGKLNDASALEDAAHADPESKAPYGRSAFYSTGKEPAALRNNNAKGARPSATAMAGHPHYPAVTEDLVLQDVDEEAPKRSVDAPVRATNLAGPRYRMVPASYDVAAL